MSRLSSLSRKLKRLLFSYLFLALAGLVIGYLIFAVVIARPKVAVLTISWAVLYPPTSSQISEVLDRLREEDSVKAVVIKLNSPGGGIAASAEILLNMVKLREKKPVVVLIDEIAASGGYYAVVGANHIYANPGSLVGNVGAVFFLPDDLPAFEDIVATGPFKLSGGSRWDYLGLLEMVKDAFVSTVVSQRGERLRLSADELSQGRIYLGIEAARLGLVDELGVLRDAIGKAARLAGLRYYAVVDVNQWLEEQGTTLYFSGPPPPTPSVELPRFPYIHYLFLGPR